MNNTRMGYVTRLLYLRVFIKYPRKLDSGIKMFRGRERTIIFKFLNNVVYSLPSSLYGMEI